MENFEISDSFVNITQLWETFFFPILGTSMTFLFTYFLVGRQYIRGIYRKHKIIKIDNKFYRQKYVKVKNIKSLGDKDERVILLPLSEIGEKMVATFQKPIVIGVVILLVVYTIYKIINLCSCLYPITYSFIGESMLLYSTPKEIIAEIWTYFPEYTLESLYQKINIMGNDSSYAKYVDYSAIHVFGSISKFCSVLCIINLFIHKPKIRIYFKTLFLFSFCLFTIILSFYFQFQRDVKVLEQKAYYVEEQLILDNPSVSTDFYAYQLAFEKVENEIRYVDNNVFYGSFSIDFAFIR